MIRRKVALVALILSLASPLLAADSDVRGLQLQVEVERRLLDAASRRWLEQVEVERRAAQALDAAATQLAAAVRRGVTPAPVAPGEPAPPSLSEASAALVEAERAVTSALAASRALAIGYDTQLVRLSALEGALQAVQGRAVATPLDGTWDVVVEPGQRGTMRLTQVGTLVTGDYAMEDGRTGSLTGTFAGGLLRLDRVDASAGKDAVLEGTLGPGRLDGTWLATIFGRGVAEAGRWAAVRRSEVVAPPAEAPAEP